MEDNIAVVKMIFEEPNKDSYGYGKYQWDISYSYNGFIDSFKVSAFKGQAPMLESKIEYHKRIFKNAKSERKVAKDIKKAIIRRYIGARKSMTNEEKIAEIKNELLNKNAITIKLK